MVDARAEFVMEPKHQLTLRSWSVSRKEQRDSLYYYSYLKEDCAYSNLEKCQHLGTTEEKTVGSDIAANQKFLLHDCSV